MGKPYIVYGADFETDNDEEKAWVVQWAISDGVTETIGKDLSSFEYQIMQLAQQERVVVYFHNLKYDLAFFKYTLDDMCKRYGFELDVKMRANSPISITMYHPGKKYNSIMFRDSMKKLPGSLREVAKLVNMKKLDSGTDFKAGWSKTFDFTKPGAWDYVCMDARIVAVAMQNLHGKHYTHCTFSSDAWNSAKDLLGNYKTKFDTWNKLFPKIDADVDIIIRHAYRGGLNVSMHHGLNEAGDIGITHADVNSMYPTVMYYDDLPIGKPVYTKTEPEDSTCYVVKALMKFKLRPEAKGLAWFQFKSSADYMMEGITKMGSPVAETKVWHELILTNIDIDTMCEWYDVEIDYSTAEFWKFKTKTGIFRPYIDFHMTAKKQAVKGSLDYQWAKRMMNSLYGRFGLNPNIEDNQLLFDSDKNDLAWVANSFYSDEIEAYVPYATFITAHARRRLLEYVMAVGPENVIHCDTDSCIHYGLPMYHHPTIKYGKDLGQWGIESLPIRVWEGGFKRYIEQLDVNPSMKAFSVACAGVPKPINDDGVPYGMWVELLDNPALITTERVLGNKNYQIQSKWIKEIYDTHGMSTEINTMKLIYDTVPGGVVLRPHQHKLNDGLRMFGNG